MKEMAIIVTVIAIILFAVICGGCQTEPEITYDPNDAIYKFIPLADQSWIDRFGDNDDTRMKHTVSELRVVVAAQGQQLKALKTFVTKIHDPNMFDPNEVKE